MWTREVFQKGPSRLTFNLISKKEYAYNHRDTLTGLRGICHVTLNIPQFLKPHFDISVFLNKYRKLKQTNQIVVPDVSLPPTGPALSYCRNSPVTHLEPRAAGGGSM